MDASLPCRSEVRFGWERTAPPSGGASRSTGRWRGAGFHEAPELAVLARRVDEEGDLERSHAAPIRRVTLGRSGLEDAAKTRGRPQGQKASRTQAQSTEQRAVRRSPHPRAAASRGPCRCRIPPRRLYPWAYLCPSA